MIEAGTWKARGCEAALGDTKGGKRQVGVDLVILEGPNTGAHITWYGYFTDASWERTIESLQLLGWDGDNLADLRGIDRNEVNVVIDHEPNPDTGEVRAKASWINQLGGVVMKNRLDAGSAAAFGAEMRGRIAALKAQQAGGQRPTRAPAVNAPDDDDIPF